MCRSAAQGGQRCAAATRARFEAATFGTVEWDEAAAAYAATPSGRAILQAGRQAAIDSGDITAEVAHAHAMEAGDRQRQVSEAARALIAAQREPGSSRLTTQGVRFYADLLAEGYDSTEAHRRAWRKYGYT